jgi:tripartite-type tricarboxylate transporter receptor subunit TctC
LSNARPARLWALAAATLITYTQAHAQQDYPSKPIRVIVPSVAGGGTDSSTRIVVSKFGELLGQRVVVDNRPGAGSIIGTEMVARSAPDGYTLLAAISSMTIQPSMQKNLPFDPIKDFAPVSVFVRLPNVLVGHPSLQPKNVKELIAFAKANPGKLEFASAGTGSNLHLCMEMFLSMAGLKMIHVPYKGASQAIADVTAGFVPFMITNMITGTAQVKAGKLRAYGVTSAKRSAAAPEIPTIAEQGVPDTKRCNGTASWLPQERRARSYRSSTRPWSVRCRTRPSRSVSSAAAPIRSAIRRRNSRSSSNRRSRNGHES